MRPLNSICPSLCPSLSHEFYIELEPKAYTLSLRYSQEGQHLSLRPRPPTVETTSSSFDTRWGSPYQKFKLVSYRLYKKALKASAFKAFLMTESKPLIKIYRIKKTLSLNGTRSFTFKIKTESMRVILNGEHAMNCNRVAWIESRAFVNCLRHELCLTAHWLQFISCERWIARQFREQIMAKPIHDAAASIHSEKRTEQE